MPQKVLPCRQMRAEGKCGRELVIRRLDLTTFSEDDKVCVCKAGYRGRTCSEKCAKSTYGELCSQRCSEHCVDQECDHRTGQCQCVENLAFGSRCDNEICSSDADCNKENGGKCARSRKDLGKKTCDCSKVLRFSGNQCQDKCVNSYGNGCKESCGHCAAGPSCNNMDGACADPGNDQLLCAKNYRPPDCKEKNKNGAELTGGFNMESTENVEEPNQDETEIELSNLLSEILGESFQATPEVRANVLFLRAPSEESLSESEVKKRRRRQAPAVIRGVNVSFTAEFPVELADTVDLQQEVTSSLKKNAKNLAVESLPGLTVDENSLSVSEVSITTSDDDQTSNILKATLFFAGSVLVVVIAVGLVLARARRRKNREISEKKKSRWKSHGRTSTAV